MKPKKQAVLSLAVLGVLLGALPVTGQSSSPNGGRLPNGDDKQLYPRWHPFVMIDPDKIETNPMSTVPNVPISSSQDPVLGVDPATGLVHIITSTIDGTPRYFNNSFGTRQANGFSEAELYGASGEKPAAIAVGPDSRVHAVWTDLGLKQDGTSAFPGIQLFIQFTELEYRVRDAAGVWGPPIQLTQAETDSNVFEGHNFQRPSITIGPNGGVHIAARYHRLHRPNIVQPPPSPPLPPGYSEAVEQDDDSIKIVHFQVDPGPATGPTDIATDFSNSGLPDFVKIEGGTDPATPTLHVSWSETDPALPSQKFLKHVVRDSGVWGTPSQIATKSGGDFDLAVDPMTDTPHFVWINTSGELRYMNPPDLPNEEVVDAAPIGAPKIVVDSKGQPHVVWVTQTNPEPGVFYDTLAYAMRSKHPDLVGPDFWIGRQDPTELRVDESFQVYDMVLGRNDTIHVVGHDNTAYDTLPLYTRSIEFNLGEQDSFAHVPVGVNASANLTNGNLLMNLPLFSSRGPGFATAMALFYNSQQVEPSVISPGWAHNYHMYLTDSKTRIAGTTTGVQNNEDFLTLHFGDGRSVVFQYVENAANESGENYHIALDEFGFFARIERDNVNSIHTKYTMTTKFGIKYRFGSGQDDFDGKLREIEDTNENKLRLTYNTDGLLSRVDDSMNRDTHLTYTSDGQLEEITDKGGKKYKLRYDPTPNVHPKHLASVTLNEEGVDPDEKPFWQFAYYVADDETNGHKTGLLATVTTPRMNPYTYTYYLDGRFWTSQDPPMTGGSPASLADAGAGTVSPHPMSIVTYYDPIDFGSQMDNGTTGDPQFSEPAAMFTNRRVKDSSVIFEQRKGVVRVAFDPLDHPITRNFSAEYRNLETFVDKEGNRTEYTYTYEDGAKEKPLFVRDNLRRIEQPPANSPSGSVAGTVMTAEYTYTHNISRVKTVKDADQNETVYDYDDSTGVDIMTGNLTKIRYPETTNAVTGQTKRAVETFKYTTKGRISQHVAPETGRTIFSAFDSQSGLAKEITRAGHSKPEKMTYDIMGNTLTHRLPENTGAGEDTVFALDGLYRVKTQTDPVSDKGERAMTDFTYDPESNTTRVDHPNDGFTENDFDNLGRLYETRQKKDGAVTIRTLFRYDPEGNTRKVTDPKLGVTETTYTARGEVLQEKRPGPPQVVTDFLYTANGNVDQQTVGGRVTTFEYTARQAVRVTNPGLTQSDENVYDDRGNLVKALHKEGGIFVNGTRNVYDARSRLVDTISLLDESTDGPNTCFGLDGNGNRTELKDAQGRVFRTEFDLADRSVVTRNAGNVITSRVTHDDNDRRRTVETLNPMTGSGLILAQTTTYTARNEVRRETDLSGDATVHSYLVGGELDTAIDPDGIVSQFQYNFLSQVTQEVRDLGGRNITTGFGYDDNGNRDTIVDPRGKTYTFIHDAANRMQTLIYPGLAGNQEGWTYDDRGNVKTHTDQRGVVVEFFHDLLDRVEREKYTTGSVTGPIIADIRRRYDGASNLLETLDVVTGVSVRNEDDGGIPGFDALNRLTLSRVLLGVSSLGETVSPTGPAREWKSVSYTYHPDSQMDTYTDPEGQVFEYGYDVEGRLETVERISGTARTFVTLEYDDAGRRRTMTLGNGMAVHWAYDDEGRVDILRASTSVGVNIMFLDYRYDARGNRDQIRYGHLGATVDYGYNSVNWLEDEVWTGNATASLDPFTNLLKTVPGGVGNESAESVPVTARPGVPDSVGDYTASYEYDNAGNRTLKTTLSGISSTRSVYDYDDENRLTTETKTVDGVTTTITYDYTLGGVTGRSPNLQVRTEGTTVETFSYDYMNRMNGYAREEGGSEVVNFTYAHLPTGERLAKINNDPGAGPNNEEWFFYDGPDVTADYVRSSNSSDPVDHVNTSTYVNGPSIDSKWVRLTGVDELYYVTDALGSVHKMFDETETERNTVLTTAWGEDHPTFTDSVAVSDRYGFTQRELNGESGIMHFRARSYEPRAGAFLQSDPPLENRVFRRFLYARNNPVNRVDPEGTQSREQIEGIARQLGVQNPGAFKNEQTKLVKLVQEKLGFSKQDGLWGNQTYDKYVAWARANKKPLVILEAPTSLGAVTEAFKKYIPRFSVAGKQPTLGMMVAIAYYESRDHRGKGGLGANVPFNAAASPFARMGTRPTAVGILQINEIAAKDIAQRGRADAMELLGVKDRAELLPAVLKARYDAEKNIGLGLILLKIYLTRDRQSLDDALTRGWQAYREKKDEIIKLGSDLEKAGLGQPGSNQRLMDILERGGKQ